MNKRTLQDIPESQLSMVLAQIAEDGATVEKVRQSDGRWTIIISLPDAPASSGRTTQVDYPIATGVEDELDHLTRFAAWIGHVGNDETLCSFSSLLIALLELQHRLSGFLKQFAQNGLINMEKLLQHRGIRTDRIPGLLARVQAGELPAGKPMFSVSARKLFEAAEDISKRVGTTGAIGVRHLLAAYAFETNEYHLKQFRDWQIDQARLQQALVDHLVSLGPSKEQAGWRRLLPQSPTREDGLAGGEPTAEMQAKSGLAAEAVITAPSPLIATFTSDNPLANPVDLLNVEDEARAFARLAASSMIEPPLSIGVFGEWGSGKTFFMERMRHHVEQLAHHFGKDELEAPFYKSIVQIQFNAWHYIETNLWASLVEFIFDELDRWLRPREAAQIEALFGQLATARQLKLEAAQELVLTRRQRKAAEQQLEEARKAYETALVRRSALPPYVFWQAVRTSFFDILAKTPEGQSASFAIKRSGERLGLPKLNEAVSDLRDVLKEAESHAGRARLIVRSMVATFGKARYWIPLAAGFILLPAALVYLADVLRNFEGLAWFQQIGPEVVTISSTLSVLAAFFGVMTKRAAAALDVLQSFQGRLEEAINEQTKAPRADVAEAERDVALRQAAVADAERQLSDAKQRVAEAQREYESGTARGRLNKFIRDKVVNGEYAKHLGIVATIRKDFSQLAQIMGESDAAEAEEIRRLLEDYNSKVEKFIAEQKDLLEKEEAAGLRAPEQSPNLRMFRRIILYIDDLDRCPPRKVVEVLQAIHLLLYFKLFVVVVAVDARWISRALKHEYPELLDDPLTKDVSRRSVRQKATVDEPGRGASPHDYLEKIFQIPYWVRPMDGPASTAFVTSLAQPDLRADEAGPAAATVIDAADRYGTQPSDQDAAGSTDIPTTRESARDVEARPPGSRKPIPLRQNALAVRPIEARPEALTLSKAEAEYMAALAPFVGQSPRRAKRVVNVYRLIKASLPPGDFETLVGRNGESLRYRAILTQLAIATGAPRAAMLYFGALPTTDGQVESLDALLTRLAKNEQLTRSAEWDVVRGALGALVKLNTDTKANSGLAMVDALHLTAPIARRYSFTARIA